MRLDPQPLFRKVIRPWYDGNTACWIVIAVAVSVVLFSLSGLSVARSDPFFHRHAWVPVTLLILSLFVLVAMAGRLIKRRYGRNSQLNEP
ncbi:MAG: hypothetical protein KFF50_05560 [Desulfatitalea sp.]|nr:hypothetical protein [Desulfatitalea sp.]